MSAVATTSLGSLAEWLRVDGGKDGYRAGLGFIDEVNLIGPDGVTLAIGTEPRPTGDERLDALLGAIAEHVAFHHGVPAPDWCEAPPRFLRTAWFPVDLPSVRVRALVSSPASFWRRGVFIDRSDLDRA